ncbi:MAG: hypothetical protein RR626_09360 [Anaerovoracaceae bacterium]
MNRSFSRGFVHTTQAQVTEKMKIGVLALGSGAGGTFVALALAEELSQGEHSVSFLELTKGREGNSLVYHILDIERRFGMNRYRPIYGEVENDRYIRGIKNLDSNINWALMTPEENLRKLALSDLQESRLINNLSGDILICDLGHEYNPTRLAEMDLIIGILDPLPSKLIGYRGIYQKLLQDNRPIIWLINKDNPGVNRKFFAEYIKVKEAAKIPLIKPEYLYQAEYNCRLPYEEREVKQILAPILKEVVDSHILITLG